MLFLYKVPPVESPGGDGSWFDKVRSLKQSLPAAADKPVVAPKEVAPERKAVVAVSREKQAEVKGAVLSDVQKQDQKIVDGWKMEAGKKSPVESAIHGMGATEEAYVLYNLIAWKDGKMYAKQCMRDGKPDLNLLRPYFRKDTAQKKYGFYYEDGEFFGDGMINDTDMDTGDFIEAMKKTNGMEKELAKTSPNILASIQAMRQDFAFLNGNDDAAPSAATGENMTTISAFLKQKPDEWVQMDTEYIARSEELFVPDAGHYEYTIAKVDDVAACYAMSVGNGAKKMFQIPFVKGSNDILDWRKDKWKQVSDIDGTLSKIARGLPAGTRAKLAPSSGPAAVVPGAPGATPEVAANALLDVTKDVTFTNKDFKKVVYNPADTLKFRDALAVGVEAGIKAKPTYQVKAAGEEEGTFDNTTFERVTALKLNDAVNARVDVMMKEIEAQVQTKFGADLAKLKPEERKEVTFKVEVLRELKVDVQESGGGKMKGFLDAANAAKTTVTDKVEDVKDKVEDLTKRGGIAAFVLSIFGAGPESNFIMKFLEGPKGEGIMDKLFQISGGYMDFRYDNLDAKEFAKDAKNPLKHRSQLTEAAKLEAPFQVKGFMVPQETRLKLADGTMKTFEKDKKYGDDTDKIMIAKDETLPVGTVLGSGTAFVKMDTVPTGAVAAAPVVAPAGSAPAVASVKPPETPVSASASAPQPGTAPTVKPS